jgi:hypothetical protein
MDSTNWSEDQKAKAGVRFASRLKELLQSQSFKLKVRRNKRAIDQRIALVNKVLT